MLNPKNIERGEDVALAMALAMGVAVALGVALGVAVGVRWRVLFSGLILGPHIFWACF